MTPSKISFWHESFQSELIPVVATNRNVCSNTMSDRTFNRYHVKEVRAHSGKELDTWIGWADQLTHSRTFHRYHVKEVRAHSGKESGKWISWADQLTHSRTFHRYHVEKVRPHSGKELNTWIGWADQLTHSRTFHRYHVKEVRAHSGKELSTWISWTDQLTYFFDLPLIFLHFHSGRRTSKKAWNEKCVVPEWNLFRYHINTTLEEGAK